MKKKRVNPNKKLMYQVRKNNLNKNRIACEMVLSEEEAELMLSAIIQFQLHPFLEFRGLESFRISVSNLLTCKYDYSIEQMDEITEEAVIDAIEIAEEFEEMMEVDRLTKEN